MLKYPNKYHLVPGNKSFIEWHAILNLCVSAVHQKRDFIQLFWCNLFTFLKGDDRMVPKINLWFTNKGHLHLSWVPKYEIMGPTLFLKSEKNIAFVLLQFSVLNWKKRLTGRFLIYYLLHTKKSVAESQATLRPSDTLQIKYVVVSIQSHMFLTHFIPHWIQHTFLQTSYTFDRMDYNFGIDQIAMKIACLEKKVWLDSLTIDWYTFCLINRFKKLKRWNCWDCRKSEITINRWRNRNTWNETVLSTMCRVKEQKMLLPF